MTNIHVSTAMPLSDTMHRQVEAWLTQRYGDHTTLYHIDESLLGGIVIFDGDNVFDGSIKGRLRQLKL